MCITPGRPFQFTLEGATGSLCIVNKVQSYEKPFLPVDEQVDQLIARGMLIPDIAAAAETLRRIGYYRLSGYWYPYRQPSEDEDRSRADTFHPGTSFTQVVDMYEFDRALRLIVLDAIERAEVALRFEVGHTLGRRGAFAHTTPECLAPEFTESAIPRDSGSTLGSQHDRWLIHRFQEEQRSKADFVKHFNEKYSPPLPVWVATEIMDFGGLSKLYAGMLQRDRDEIASHLGILTPAGEGNSSALKSWMVNITYVRNICAHHARLWNANIVQRIGSKQLIGVPELVHIKTMSARTERLYPTLAVLAFLVSKVAPESTWRVLLQHQLNALPSQHSLAEMGFPPGWENLTLWNPPS